MIADDSFPLIKRRGAVLRAAAFYVLALSAACVVSSDGPVPAGLSSEKKIEYYKERIARFPRHYPSHTGLALAFLDRTHETGDPANLAAARENARRSIEIQPNYEAFKALARIEGFAHRFEESIRWAEKALEASPEPDSDTEISSILMDAHLGLANAEEAERIYGLLKSDDFFSASARAQFLRSDSRLEQASLEFQLAASAARMRNSGEAEAWAELMTAGIWLDAGNPDRAEPFLKRAEKLIPGSKSVRIHRAEFFAAKGHVEKALEVYVNLLASGDDPEIHRRIFLILDRLERKVEAAKHFEAAERGFKKPIEAGEVYTLGNLAQLLCDEVSRLEEALKISEENLKFKRDKEAIDTQACILRRSHGINTHKPG